MPDRMQHGVKEEWPTALRPPTLPYWAEDTDVPLASVAAAIADRASGFCVVGDMWTGMGLAITVVTVARERSDAAAITFALEQGGLRRHGTLLLVPDPDGWVRVEVLVDGERWIAARAELVYEEIEFWPPGAEGDSDGEAPGRISKRGTWAQIDSARWPHLAGAPEQWLAIELVSA